MEWKYNGVSDSIQSSLLILGGSFVSHQTYQWMVIMENRRSQSVQGTGYVLIQVEETFPPMIATGYNRQSSLVSLIDLFQLCHSGDV
jgi:hypothetical protein